MVVILWMIEEGEDTFVLSLLIIREVNVIILVEARDEALKLI